MFVKEILQKDSSRKSSKKKSKYVFVKKFIVKNIWQVDGELKNVFLKMNEWNIDFFLQIETCDGNHI